MISSTRVLLLATTSVAGFVIFSLAADAAQSAPQQLTISYSQKTPDFLPIWIASDAGYFKKRGLDVKALYLRAQEGIPALISRQTQVVGIGATDALSAVAQGTELRLVTTLTPTYTFQFWARPEYRTADALKGQRVGITSKTGSLYAATLLAFQELGLKPTDVAITPLGGVTNVNSALLSGSIAAAASHPPATYKFKQAGLVQLVDLAQKHIPSVSAGLWVAPSFIQEHRKTVQDVVDSIVEAIQREKSDRDYAEQEMTKHLGVKDKAELDFTYDFYVKEILGPGPMPEAAQIESNKKALSASNSSVANVDVKAMFDRSFIEQAEQKSGSVGSGNRNSSGTSPK